MVDNSQLLFGEQLDQIALGLDEAGHVRILSAQVSDDLVLLRARRDRNWNLPKLVKIQPKAHIHYAPRPYFELLKIFLRSE